MAKLIGAAGHVDHGKTTLIRALTGIDADRLPEEKRRGMTIEIGFAYFDSPKHGRVSVVDVPGHEKFIRNMLVGALGIDVALLCVAADAGVSAQTREHFQILESLPVERMVVALTKSDLVDKATLTLALEEVGELLAETRFAGSPTQAVSAVSGAGLSELKELLEAALESSVPSSEGPWYLPVDRVFTVKGHGVVATGTLARGALKVGDVAILQPGGFEVRVRGLHVHSEPVEASERGRRTAVNLAGIRGEDVRRGMTLGHPDSLFETRAIEVKIRWAQRPKHGSTVRVSIGAEEAIGRVFLSRDDEALATVRLVEPVGATKGQPVVLRRASPMKLLGGGVVVTPVAAASRKAKPTPELAEHSDDEAILMLLEGQTHGVETAEIARRLGRTPQALGDAFEGLLKSEAALGFAGLWFETKAFSEAAERLRSALEFLHSKEPQKANQPKEKVVAAAKLPWTGKPLDRIVAHLDREGIVIAQSGALRLPEFSIALNPKQRAFLDRVIETLDKSTPGVPGAGDLARELNVPPQAVDEILKLGLQSRELVRVGPDMHYSASGLEALVQQARALLKKPFAASEFRDAIAASRKYAIPLLEHLDATRVTLRQGDLRVFRD